MQNLVPTAQPCSAEARTGTSSQANSLRDVMKRPKGDDVTLTGLVSLKSRTGTLVVIVGGLVRVKIFY